MGRRRILSALNDETEAVAQVLSVGPRFTFPLRQGLAADINPSQRLLMLGDAARTLHPMAGQGVNVGLEDVRVLLARLPDGDLAPPGAWRRFAADRRARSKLMLGLHAALLAAYGAKAPLVRAVRNMGVRFLDGNAPIKAQLVREGDGRRGAGNRRHRRIRWHVVTEPRRTPLYDEHVARSARMVPFAGWSMPLHYGSQIAEHHAVRQGVGMFDVSHMRVIDVAGAGATDFLRTVFAGDVAPLAAGRALYGVLLNENAGIIDDAIIYRTDGGYRVVANAGTSERVHSWLVRHASDETHLHPRQDVAMLAVQGPGAIDCFHEATGFDGGALPRFAFAWHEERMVARTGYTGEDGVEAIVPAEQAASLWRRLTEAGATPAGLGARDTLRLEAGLNLHGHDMDESTPPTAVGLGWTVAWGEDDARCAASLAATPSNANVARNKCCAESSSKDAASCARASP